MTDCGGMEQVGNHKHWGCIHTNGVKECYQCGKFIMSAKQAEGYKSLKQYEGKIIIKEGKDESNLGR
jgi:hypothetical protein